MNIRQIEFDSVDYDKMIRLRLKVLLNPIGISESYINKEKEKEDILIGAFEGLNLIGCCILTKLDPKIIQLRQMAVEQGHQGQNIGKEIVLYAEQTAFKNGYTTLIMHARNPVLGFYKKCGYQIEGGEFFEVGIGHHTMTKQLQ